MIGYVYHVIIYFDFAILAEGAKAALSLSGTMLGYYPVRVLPSKTAIAPVNPTFLPRVSLSLTAFVIFSFYESVRVLEISFSFGIVIIIKDFYYPRN